MTLPLLVLDERVLSPQFGFVFRRRWLQPYESIVGMLWKFARMNQLPGHATIQHLCREPVDPYEGLNVDQTDVARVAKLLGVTQRTVRSGIVFDSRGCSPMLRHCPRCMSMGYHGRAHQLLHHDLCPAHGLPLTVACPRCAQPSAYRLTAQLLDSPFRCSHCRHALATCGSSPTLARWAIPAPERIAFTRANVDGRVASLPCRRQPSKPL